MTEFFINGFLKNRDPSGLHVAVDNGVSGSVAMGYIHEKTGVIHACSVDVPVRNNVFDGCSASTLIDVEELILILTGGHMDIMCQGDDMPVNLIIENMAHVKNYKVVESSAMAMAYSMYACEVAYEGRSLNSKFWSTIDVNKWRKPLLQGVDVEGRLKHERTQYRRSKLWKTIVQEAVEAIVESGQMFIEYHSAKDYDSLGMLHWLCGEVKERKEIL